MNYYPLKTANTFSLIFATKSGLPVEDMHFNSVLNVWFGTVSGVRHVWNSDGKCIDRTRPDLDLF
jgi:hypothetical protein